MNTRLITKMALLVALCCISAFISIKLPFIPGMITALTLVFCLIAFLLPPELTFITIAVYIFLGAIGLPVYTGGTAGYDKLFGPTGGFLWSFLVAYPVLSHFKGSIKIHEYKILGKVIKIPRYFVRAALITIPITHIMGMIGGMIFIKLSLVQAFLSFSVPFIPLDILKCYLAVWVAIALKKANV